MTNFSNERHKDKNVFGYVSEGIDAEGVFISSRFKGRLCGFFDTPSWRLAAISIHAKENRPKSGD